MIVLCKMLGGSHAYGLNTPSSDIDYRGVFLCDTIGDTLGLDKFEQLNLQDNDATKDKKDKQDEQYYELRHYLQMLRKTNTQCLELLFNDNWVLLDPSFKLIVSNRAKLLDTDRFYHSIKGYMHGEMRLANGERTGKLGGKRKEALERYGFSPNNFSHIFRLGFCAIRFFRTGVYPVDVMKCDPIYGANLKQIKLHPEKFTAAELTELALKTIQSLDEAYADRVVEYKFDLRAANDLCFRLYYTVVKDLYKNLPVMAPFKDSP